MGIKRKDEEAGQGQKSIDDQMMDMSQFSAFAPPSVSSASSSSSSSASSKGCSSVVVSLPNNSIIGMVIGKKGTNIKKIQRDTNTYITTVKGDFVDFTVNCTSNADPSDVEGAAKILRNYYNITLTPDKSAITRIKKLQHIIKGEHKVKLKFDEGKVTIIGSLDNVRSAADSIRRESNQAFLNQGKNVDRSVNLTAAAMSKAQSQPKKPSKKVARYQVDKRFHDDLVAIIDQVKMMSGAKITVEPVSASSKITITLEGNKKAQKRALVLLNKQMSTKGLTIMGGGKTRKKRKNKSRKKKRRNKRRRTRRRC